MSKIKSTNSAIGVFKQVKYHQILIISMFCSIFMISCSSSNNSNNGEECIGIDFSQTECIGEFLSTDGLRFGCDECISDFRGEEFSIEFFLLLVPPDQAPLGIGTQFTVDGIEGAFIPEFESCSMIIQKDVETWLNSDIGQGWQVINAT